jgi:competence protein ComGC
MTRPSNISALSAEALIEQKQTNKKNKKNHKQKKNKT